MDSGVTLLSPKPNILKFTATERDETITYNESAFGKKNLSIQLFVWQSLENPIQFAQSKTFSVSEGLPPSIPSDAKKSGFMGAGLMGITATLILLGFVSEGLRKK